MSRIVARHGRLAGVASLWNGGLALTARSGKVGAGGTAIEWLAQPGPYLLCGSLWESDPCIKGLGLNRDHDPVRSIKNRGLPFLDYY